MSKKMMLVGVLSLLLLFSTLVSADIQIIPLTPPPNIQPLPDLSYGVSLFTGELQQNELLVELVANVPSNLKVNDQFWVDIYVTTGTSNDYMKEIKLILTSSDGTAAVFTGNGKTDYFTSLEPTYTGGAFITKPGSYLVVNPRQRYKLGSLEMQVVSTGKPFSVNLDKITSIIYILSNINPPLIFDISKSSSSAIMVKLPKTVCIPQTVCPPGYSCGIQDNGCGGVISCGTCAQGTFCAGGSCAAPELLLQNPNDAVLCQLIVDIPADSDKVLLKTIGETLQGWGNVCSANTDCKAGYSCNQAKCTATELSVLSPIFTALKTWLSVKFPQ